MGLEVSGVITKILPIQKGVSKAGKDWEKQSFLIETSDQYNNLYCFEIFSSEKVEDFGQRYKIGDSIKVDFNVNTNEWNDKYFTSLSAWRIEKLESANIPQSSQTPPPDIGGGDEQDMPF